MKILLIHNFYNFSGGEDTVFNQELELLSKDHDVRAFTIRNKTGIEGGLEFLKSIWNFSVGKALSKEISEFRPDVIHMHNIHFSIGPIAIRVAYKNKVPIVMTLHNYRLLCPSGILHNKGSVFTESLNSKFPWTAIFSRVYRNSFFQTLWLAITTFLHGALGTWNMVDSYLVFTEFSQNLFCQNKLGISKQKFKIKPNFVPRITKPEKTFDLNCFLYVGRLSEEKGLDLLISTFKNSGYKLKIIGSGPLQNEVLELCQVDKNITYLGYLSKDKVTAEMNACTALIFASTWYEGMPMTIIESFAVGLPVIASDLGAMSSMVTHNLNGLHFEAGNKKSLVKQLEHWNILSAQEQNIFRTNALNTYKENYTPEKNLDLLHIIYNQEVKIK